MPSGQGCQYSQAFEHSTFKTVDTDGLPAGTNPIHNKKPKKQQKDLDEDELAFKEKQQAGIADAFIHPAKARTDNFGDR